MAAKLRRSLNIFVAFWVLIPGSCALQERAAEDTVSAEAGRDKLEGTLREVSKGEIYRLEIRKAGTKRDVLYSEECSTELKIGDGQRLSCEKPGRADTVDVVYRDDLQSGAVVIQTAEIFSVRNGQRGRRFLRCKTAGSGKQLALTCDETRNPRPARKTLTSPFPSMVEGLDLPNSHTLAGDPKAGPFVIRAMAPSLPEDYNQLINDLGLDEVLIFKTPIGDEVTTETNDLLAASEGQQIGVHKIDFPYFGYERLKAPFQEPCTQIVKGLGIIHNAVQTGRRLLIHCTVGEDRTGALAGLYRLLSDPQADLPAVFVGEMCEHGYEGGNPQKPSTPVVKDIREDLTPLFLKMAYLIKQGRITAANLETAAVAACTANPQEGPAAEPEFKNGLAADYEAGKYLCGTSTRYQP